MFKNLFRAIRIYDISLIPKELLDSVAQRSPWTTDDLVGAWPLLGTAMFNFLYVFVDGTNKVRGWAWANAIVLTKDLYVQALAFDKEAQRQFRKEGTTAIKEVVPWLRGLYKTVGAKGVLLATNRIAALKRYADMKETSFIVMEGR